MRSWFIQHKANQHLLTHWLERKSCRAQPIQLPHGFLRLLNRRRRIRGNTFFGLGEKISMLFEGDKYKISGNIEEDLRSKLNDCLENTKLKSLTRNIYHSLKVINDYANDDGKKISFHKLITVDVPFSNGIIKKLNINSLFMIRLGQIPKVMKNISEFWKSIGRTDKRTAHSSLWTARQGIGKGRISC